MFSSQILDRRVGMAAHFHCLVATGMEGTASGQVDDVWRLTFDGEEAVAFLGGIHAGNTLDEPLGIGMAGSGIQVLGESLLYHTSGVHDTHLVTHACHHSNRE